MKGGEYMTVTVKNTNRNRQRKVGFFGNLRFSIGKQVKAAPLYGVGISHRTAEPTEFASFDEL